MDNNEKSSSSSSSLCHHSYEIVDIRTWLHSAAADFWTPLPLIDLRSCSEYNVRHLLNKTTVQGYDDNDVNNNNNNNNNNIPITIVHLPLESLLNGERSCELPPRHLEFAILIPRKYVQTFLNHYEKCQTTKTKAIAQRCTYDGCSCCFGGGDCGSCTNILQSLGEELEREQRPSSLSSSSQQHCNIHKLFFSSRSTSTMQSRQPWKVRQVFLDSDEFWQEAEKTPELIVATSSGSSSSGGSGGGSWDSTHSDSSSSSVGQIFQCLPRLWKPDPLISSYVLPYLKEWYLDTSSSVSGVSEDKRMSSLMGLVWDFGCGSGRDLCYLAEEMKEFCNRSSRRDTRTTTTRIDQEKKKTLFFIGIDNHKGSAARCIPLWKNRGVEDITRTICLNLNKLTFVRDCLHDPRKVVSLSPSSSFSSLEDESTKVDVHHHHPHSSDIVCIYSIRFLNRKLLAYIANSDTDQSSSSSSTIISSQPLVLPIGTIIAISHFCKTHEGASWEFEHPKEANVLNRWELQNLFHNTSDSSSSSSSARRWQILLDSLIMDGDHGRTLIQFVAKKIA